MMRTAGAIAIVLLSAASPARAHGLDEFAQALRVGVAPDHITLDFGLTPGVAVAASLIANIDADGDGTISPSEAEHYGRSVVADLDATVDEVALGFRLVRVDLPPAGDMRDGLGTIRIEAIGPASLRAGSHVVVVRNTHRPEASSYLSNALLPKNDSTRIVRQERDATQQTLTISVEIAGDRQTAAGWTLGGAALLLMHAGWRKTRAGLGILRP